MKKKTIAIGIVAILAISLAIGATVKYLSNINTVTFSADSPMSSYINETGTSTYDLGALYGGETVEFTTMGTNNANQAIDVYKPLTVFTAPSNLDGSEFDSVLLNDNGADVGDILAQLCFVRANGTSDNFANIASEAVSTAKLMRCSDGVNIDAMYSHPSATERSYKLTIDLNAGIQSGNYSISSCFINDLTGTCQ